MHARHGLMVGLERLGPLRVAGEVAVDADPVHLAADATISLPTTGMLFSETQATTHALQPMQAFMSIVMPQAWPSYLCFG